MISREEGYKKHECMHFYPIATVLALLVLSAPDEVLRR